MRKSSEKFNKLWEAFYGPNAFLASDSERSPYLRKLDEIRWRWFWSYQDELRGLRQYQVVIDATRMLETNNSFQTIKDSMEKNLTKLYSEHDSWNLRGAFSANSAGAALRKAVRIEAARNILITAIALKRYHLKYGNYPADLNSIVPEFVSTVPLDSIDGKPLRYKLNSDGTFLLYSVGANGVDDGGNPSLEKYFETSIFYWQNDHTLDWVWPQPATEDEIQAYYKKLSAKSN